MKTNKGQSSIEFLLIFSFALFFILYFLKLSLNATNGFLFHYANFLASRAYLVYDSQKDILIDDADAKNYALQNVLQNFPLKGLLFGMDKNLPLNFEAISPSFNNKFIGTTLEFKQKFSFSKLLGGNDPLLFYSESFLGREPTKKECQKQICNQMQILFNDECSSSFETLYMTLFDNEC